MKATLSLAKGFGIPEPLSLPAKGVTGSRPPFPRGYKFNWYPLNMVSFQPTPSQLTRS